MESPLETDAPRTTKSRPLRLAALAVGIGALIAVASVVAIRAAKERAPKAAAARPKAVTVVTARDATFRASHAYVGTFAPWLEAKIGPQLVSAYVDAVLVRPGDVVQRGDVLATLDCKNASAASEVVAMQARAIEKRQRALANESSRITGMLDGGFVSKNEAEQAAARAAEEEATLLSERARLLSRTLEVSDCVLRAPFDGEIASRTVDPGAFVSPGTAVVSEVDRRTVRFAFAVPESDFDVVRPGTPVTVHVLATNADVVASVTRRAPGADPATRTVACEVDIADPTRGIPATTTGELRVEVGSPSPAVSVPLAAATLRNEKATLFVVENGRARSKTVHVLGESDGTLFLKADPELPAGSAVVLDGRALVEDGDAVDVKPAPEEPAK